MLPRSGIEGGLDAETELPAFFSQRRVAQIAQAQKGMPEKAILYVAKSESLGIRGERARARQALEQAVELAPESPTINLQLGLMLEEMGEYELATARYRKVIASQPRNAIALNNLAYGLAVHRKMPAEGLSFAQQAVAAAPGDANIQDTLAWIHHLMGNDVEAAKILAGAIRLAPNNPDVRLHAAVVFAARGALAVSESELKEALRLRPALEQSDEVRRLRARLAELAKQ
jgi:Tfp pilus assembly protein PilF